MQCVVTVDSHNEIEILKRRSTRHNNTFKPAMYVIQAAHDDARLSLAHIALCYGVLTSLRSSGHRWGIRVCHGADTRQDKTSAILGINASLATPPLEYVIRFLKMNV